MTAAPRDLLQAMPDRNDLGIATRPETARREGDIVVIAAGVPFGTAGNTNLLKIMSV